MNLAESSSLIPFARNSGLRIGLSLLTLASLIVGIMVVVVSYSLLREPPHEPITYNLTSNKISFISLGDQGTGNFRQWQVAQSMKNLAAKNDLDFVMLLGDNFYRYGIESIEDPQWLYKFENMYRSDELNQTPFYAVLGNHDYGGNEQAEFEYSYKKTGSGRWHMPSRDYVEYYGAAEDRALLKVVYLDTSPLSRSHANTAQQLVSLLESSQPAIWTIVASHVPVRTGGHDYFDQELVGRITPILKKFEVAAYFSGHDHNQQLITRPGEPLYIVSGTGGKHGVLAEPGFEPGLDFSDPQLGFVYTSITEDELNIEFFNDKNEQLYQRRLSHMQKSRNGRTELTGE